MDDERRACQKGAEAAVFTVDERSDTLWKCFYFRKPFELRVEGKQVRGVVQGGGE